MAIDPDMYEKISGRRANDAAYGAAILEAGRPRGESMSFMEARSRGRRWLAIGAGLFVLVGLVYLFSTGGI